MDQDIANIAELTTPNAATGGNNAVDPTPVLIFGGILLAGVGIWGYKSWQREQARLDKMTPTERHQYEVDRANARHQEAMDGLKYSVANSLLSKF